MSGIMTIFDRKEMLASVSIMWLLERAVQEMMTFISKKCIERRTNAGWSLLVRDGNLEMNTKSVRIHGYSPAQLVLGYEPQLFHFNTDPAPMPLPEEVEEDVPPSSPG